MCFFHTNVACNKNDKLTKTLHAKFSIINEYYIRWYVYRNPNMDGTTIIIIYEPILRTQHIMDYWTEYTHTLTNPLHRYVILIQQVSVSIVTFFNGGSVLFICPYKMESFFSEVPPANKFASYTIPTVICTIPTCLWDMLSILLLHALE